MRRAVLAAVVLTAACGPKRPPPSFAPDPGLVEQIRELRMSTSTRACPGESFGAVYTAVLNDGSIVPFESRYDEDHPPRLHVIFLERRRITCSPTPAPFHHPTGSSSRRAAPTAPAARRERQASQEQPASPVAPAAPAVPEALVAMAAAAGRVVVAARSRSSPRPRSRFSPAS